MSTPQHDAQLTAADVETVRRHVRDHLSGPVTVDGLAELVGFSPSCFARLFKQATGVTPHQFVIEQRIERAKALFAHDPSTPISRVAAQTGFSDQAHLTRTFRRVVGQTPGDYIAASQAAALKSCESSRIVQDARSVRG